jgi:hypothetical protein
MTGRILPKPVTGGASIDGARKQACYAKWGNYNNALISSAAMS